MIKHLMGYIPNVSSSDEKQNRNWLMDKGAGHSLNHLLSNHDHVSSCP
jgi:hypothetical protein